MALSTGLRVKELRSLSIENFEQQLCGLWLDAEWTKNRKSSFHPLPKSILSPLRQFIDSGSALDLYRDHFKRKDCKRVLPKKPLLYVPSNPARELERDLVKAGISKSNSEGKVDFHSLRVTYISMVIEFGASAKEAQELARHSSPNLTMNTYATCQNERLHKIADNLGNELMEKENKALFKPSMDVELSHRWPNGFNLNDLGEMETAGVEPDSSISTEKHLLNINERNGFTNKELTVWIEQIKTLYNHLTGIEKQKFQALFKPENIKAMLKGAFYSKLKTE